MAAKRNSQSPLARTAVYGFRLIGQRTANLGRVTRKGMASRIIEKQSRAVRHCSFATSQPFVKRESQQLQETSALNLQILCRRFALVCDFFVFDDLPLIQTAEAS